jgi:tetratricopeptide (TPR) repeat protein
MASIPPATPSFRLPRWLAVGSIVAAVLLVYANTLRAPFLFDDAGAVLQNPTIRRLGSLEVLRPPADGSTTTGRPVVNLSLALNYAVSGEHPWSYHALNIAIHALAAVVLFGLVRRTIVRARLVPAAIDAGGVAWVVALGWAVHPLLTESVTCVAQRTESLCGLFYLLTLYGFVRGLEAGGAGARRTWWAISVVACALGMGTKEVMVTAPVLVWLYDRTFGAGSLAAAWRARKSYYAGLAATWSGLIFLLVSGAGARGASAGFGLGVSWWSYLLKQAEALVLYVKLAVWPQPLVLDYGTAVAGSVGDVWWQGLVVFGLLGATGWALVRRPVAGFVGAWFFVILAPSSSVVPLVTQTVAEHRMYLPLAGLAAAGVIATVARFGRRALGVGLVLILAGGVATVARNRDYRDGVGIWADTVAKAPANARAHNNLAQALQEAGRSVEAEGAFKRAVDLAPDYVSARYNYGVALFAAQRVPEAAEQWARVVRLAPDHADAHLNLGNALVRLQRAAEAVPHYERALALRPGADAHFNIGIALMATDRAAEAAGHFQSAVRLEPGLVEARYQLARLAERAGPAGEAERGYAEVLKLAPDHLGAHRRLGLICARSERLTEAAGHFRAVIRLQPTDADAQANLGNVLLIGGQVREAIACYEAVLRLRPDDARARENLQTARGALR